MEVRAGGDSGDGARRGCGCPLDMAAWKERHIEDGFRAGFSSEASLNEASQHGNQLQAESPLRLRFEHIGETGT